MDPARRDPPRLEKDLAKNARLFHSSHRPDGGYKLTNLFRQRSTLRSLIFCPNNGGHFPHHLVPGQAYCVAGKVNSADKLYLVIESARPDTKHARNFTAPVPPDGAGENSLD